MSRPKFTLNVYQQISHKNMKNLLVVAFQFQLYFYAGNLCKYHLHTVTNHWVEASHLYKAKTEVVVEWIIGERHISGSMGRSK